MKTFWLIAAAVCGVVALYFAFKRNYDNALIAAALGGCAAFLNYRAQLRQTLNDDEDKNHTEEPADEHDE